MRRFLCRLLALALAFVVRWQDQGDLASWENNDLTRLSHYWGQYSPYFKVPSTIPADVPEHCEVTFAQILSRHGARSPTRNKGMLYNDTIIKIQSNAWSYDASGAFLEHMTYNLGSEGLTQAGELQMVESGLRFVKRYLHLAATKHLFVRATDQGRVHGSAENFTTGFSKGLVAAMPEAETVKDYPYNILAMPEDNSFNNTLSHGLCDNFESEEEDIISARGQANWTRLFVPPIRKRLNTQVIRGANLTDSETIQLMDLCPFHFVASASEGSKLTYNFCMLFTEHEWHQYNYYQTLGKFNHYGEGDPLGPTQGVGWSNELIARLTHRPVEDRTSTNHTLASNNATFPNGPDNVLFADFSHDNEMTAILFALGLYNATKSLPGDRMTEAQNASGYSAAWTVPFAARIYVEKLMCEGTEFVRFLVNDRVLSLDCADEYGRCDLNDYLGTLSFATSGGKWDECFS